MPPPDIDRSLIAHYQKHGFADDEDLLAFMDANFFPDKTGASLHIPRRAVCPEHTAPADYLLAAFFGRELNTICWANRGGGKTLLAALVTWLDSVFKPGCTTRILGGSLEQSRRVYEHLTGERDGWQLINDPFRHLIRGDILKEGLSLTNHSNIQIMPASQKTVRGAHPHKLKLDEIDEMDPAIFQAALSTSMSRANYRASVNIYSTMHKTYGLMQTVVEEAATRGYRIYKWCIMDVLERCEGRECGACVLWDDCQGRAREADGYYRIEDAITKKRQVSEQTWISEYLCLIPSSEGLIYKEFDMALHVI